MLQLISFCLVIQLISAATTWQALHPVVDPAIPHYKPRTTALTDQLNSVGANTMDSMTLRWLELFRNSHPEVATTMQALASGTVYTGFLTPVSTLAVQVGPCAREQLPIELAEIRAKYGYDLLPFRVAGGSFKSPGYTHAIVFYVHKTNPLDRLSFSQLANAWRDGGVTTWGSLGATGEWADKKINLWGLVYPNGIAHYVQINVLNGGPFRTDINTVTSDTIPALDKISFAVSQDPYAMGYAGVSNWNPGVKILSVSTTGDYVYPSWEKVLSKEYPLSRFVYINVDPNRPLHPNVVEFLRVVLSYEGQEIVAQNAAFLPLPASIVEEELRKLELFATNATNVLG
jgi:phosphate transport system substrate-binding protein